MPENLLLVISKLRISLQKVLHTLCSKYSQERHCTRGKVVPYKRLKTVENYKTVRGKFGVLDRLSLTWEVVAYERWSDMEVQM